MKLILYTWVGLTLLFSSHLRAQRNCATMDMLNEQIKTNPFILKNMEEIERQTLEFVKKNPKGLSQRAVITIPVVFHIVYDIAAPVQNISDEQIQSQLDVLNQDFRALNADFANVPPLFTGAAADVEIQFCLAQRDPNGNAATGITRKSSTKTFWDDPFTNLDDNDIKQSSKGGVDPWNTANYLNIWVCRISQSNTSITAGYAQLPGGSPATDGVVMDYRVTGTLGTATAPFNKGRTATHEIGHWLNLRHIWGDATCGSDLVNDTPTHNAANGGCPVYPHLSTCSGTPVEMTMNYMDYTDDACMYMFSAGQKARMQAVLASGGARASLLCSPGCLPPGSGSSCDAPTGLNVTNITQTSVTVGWNAAPNAVSYTLEYKPDYFSIWTVVSPDVVGTSYTITGLTGGTFYNFRIKTNCSGSSSCGYATGAFSTAFPPAPCADSYESNNTSGTAKSITIGATISASISTSTDVDWFKFANSKTKKNIRVDLTNLPANYDIKLFRGTSTQVGISQNTGITSELIKYNNTLSNTTYYVQVYGVGGAFNNFQCYNLKVQISGTNFREGTLDDQNIEAVDREFLVFPNPAKDAVTLVVPFGDNKDGIITVYDVTGKMLSSEKIRGDKALKTFNMDISQYKSGIYMINFTSGEDSYTQKMVVGDDR